MTNNNTILYLQIYKLITEYQIRWLSTSYEIAPLSYLIITRAFPNVDNDKAQALLNEWLQYETSQNISVYSKARFNEDSNVETILKLQKLIRVLDEHIAIAISELSDNPETTEEKHTKAFEIEKDADGGINITFFNKSWFKRANVIHLSMEVAKELCEELNKL